MIIITIMGRKRRRRWWSALTNAAKAGKDVGGKENASGNLKWVSLAVSQNVKHSVTTWLSNSTLRCIPKRNENTHPLKNLSMTIFSSITHHSQRVGTAQMPINCWMDKSNVEYLYNGMKPWHVLQYEWPRNNYAKFKKPATKDRVSEDLKGCVQNKRVCEMQNRLAVARGCGEREMGTGGIQSDFSRSWGFLWVNGIF